MKSRALSEFKRWLTLVGSVISPKGLHHVEMIVNYMKLGRWMRDNGFEAKRRLPHREAVFDTVINEVREQQVLYLEFGVFEGASMRYWSESLGHPDAVLRGFDSFEGLPEHWGFGFEKGRFDRGGSPPVLADDRVEFIKGWFEETLPGFAVPPHEVLVIVMDADLYSSTIYVLRQLEKTIGPGTYIYFDDMSRPDHEPRAFEEFIQESGRRFRLVGADRSLNTAFFQCIG